MNQKEASVNICADDGAKEAKVSQFVPQVEIDVVDNCKEHRVQLSLIEFGF